VISANVLEDEQQKVIDVGADAFLRKPIEVPVLFDTIGKLLGIKYVYAPTTKEESNGSPGQAGHSDFNESKAPLKNPPNS